MKHYILVKHDDVVGKIIECWEEEQFYWNVVLFKFCCVSKCHFDSPCRNWILVLLRYKMRIVVKLSSETACRWTLWAKLWFYFTCI